jgi:hypothetical protein
MKIKINFIQGENLFLDLGTLRFDYRKSKKGSQGVTLCSSLAFR